MTLEPSPNRDTLGSVRTLKVVPPTLIVAALLTTVGAAGAELPPGGTFRDDDGNPHEGNIEAIAAADITRGCNPPINDLYCPDRILDRGEIAAFIVRMLDLPATNLDFFGDDEESVFENDINRLAAAGITRGCDPPANTMYCPLRKLNRGEITAFLVRALDLTDAGPGDFYEDDDTSVFEHDIDRLTHAGIGFSCNPPEDTMYCPAAAVPRDEMATFLAKSAGLDPIFPPPRLVPALETVVTGLSAPTHLAAPPGDDRLFITEKGGRVRIVEDGQLLATPFLDISATTRTTSEAGLLSIAFHPDYATNGRFFVYQSRNLRAGGSGNHTSYVWEFEVSADPDVADAFSATEIFVIDQPASNHNGGQIEFGPDGYLWIGLGDGGGSHDDFAHGQDVDTLHGALLRIDVDAAAPYAVPADNPFVGGPGADEIWAYGLRNPWRWAFYDGDLYVADVGQNAREEVNVLPLTEAGANFGWCLWEGTLKHSHPSGDQCDGNGSGLTFPVAELTHGNGNCSITGGRAYEGSELPDLVGHYFYIDLCNGRLKSFEWDGAAVANAKDWTADFGKQGGVWSFGSGSDGTLYLVFGGSGIVKRLSGV
jgi:glucose/arabinose dehydrogenase